MTDLQKMNLKSAETSFALANTPLFLIRKLQADPVVLEIRQRFSEEEIYAALEYSLKQEPMNLSDAVRPYVYLVSLAGKSDMSFLRRAVELGSDHADWYHYIANVLLQTYKSTSISTYPIPNSAIMSHISMKTSTPTSQSRTIIKAGV